MRALLAFVLIAGLATALDAPDGLERLFGDKGWGRLPEWRQKDILRRWEQLQRMSEDKQSEIRKKGLRAWLIKPATRFRLPRALHADIERLPSEVRPLASKLAVMRLRHMRLDRNLAMVPFAKRRGVFRRLFPEPFDRRLAAKAGKELARQVSGALVRRLLPEVKAREAELGRPLTKQEKASLVRALTVQEDDKIISHIRKELKRFRRSDAGRIRRTLEAEGYPLLERIQLMATPRQRELIRYAFRPERCPLIDMRFMGPKPTEPEARRLWEHDFRVLARIDLLSEARFPPEMVLHLAASSSPADFFRAAKALVRQRPTTRPGQRPSSKPR